MAQGNSTNTSNPITVSQGGTGVSTLTTAYAPICSGTSATGPLQVASTGIATAGYVLTSNGPSALPSFQQNSASSGFTSIKIVTITSTQVYNPTANTSFAIVEIVGGGGNGGSSGGSSGEGGGGGGGGYAKKIITSPTSVTVTIGGPTQTTSYGSVFSASGGSSGSTGPLGAGGSGGAGSGGDVNIDGGDGQSGGVANNTPTFGGGSVLGMLNGASVGNGAGKNGNSYGGGGSGGIGISQSGGSGASGVCIITEFIT